MSLSLSKQDVKRISIRAQGLAEGRITSSKGQSVTTDDVSRSIRTMGLLQIDSVNVCVRSHYMPLFSRLGTYDRILLDELAYNAKSIFETWAHAACYVPVEHHRLFRPRMARQKPNNRVAKLMEEKPGFVESAMEQLGTRGPLTASELRGAGKRSGPWWGYSPGKIAMEWHFALGKASVATRKNFVRYYDLTERVISKLHLDGPTPTVDESHREMMYLAVQAHGVGTVSDLANYYHIHPSDAEARLDELVEAGAVIRVNVEGWVQDGYAPADIVSAGPVNCRALLTPFDPLIWRRDRTERIFDFWYRIEIYVPEKKRKYGYYVYPFLLGENLVARVDLKAERKKNCLLVKSAFIEEGRDQLLVAENLADELRLMADWLGLNRIGTGRRGGLMPALRKALNR